MPWELGRCSPQAGDRNIDVQNVIWLGTSNIGHDLISQDQSTSWNPDSSISREDYLKLTDVLRPQVSDRLGVSFVVVICYAYAF